MYVKKIIAVACTAFFLSSAFIFSIALAEGDIDRKIDASFDIIMESATDYKITATMDIYKINVFDTAYTNVDIQSLSDPEIMGAIKLSLRNELKDQLEDTFKHATVTALIEKPSYESTQFYDEFSINLTSSFFDLNETVNAHDFINGLVDIKANITYSIDLHAAEGWNNTFNFFLSDEVKLRSANTDHIGIKDELIWILNNWNGKHPEMQSTFKITSSDTKSPKFKYEKIDIRFLINSSDVKKTSLTSTMVISSIDFTPYESNIPDFVDGVPFISSDGLRLFVHNGLTNWDEIYKTTISPLENKIKNQIETSSFNQTLTFEFQWDNKTSTECSDPYNINNMDCQPPIEADLLDEDIDLKICDISNRAFFGLVNNGAQANISEDDLNFGGNLGNIGHGYNVTFIMPEHIYLEGSNIYIWNESSSFSGNFESEIAPSYNQEKKEMLIELEFQNADLNLVSILEGKSQISFSLFIKEKRKYNVTALPDELSIPQKIDLEFLNADAFRLCAEEKVFTANDLAGFLNEEKNIFEGRLCKLVSNLNCKDKGRANIDIFEKSLNNWEGDISQIDAAPPVNVDFFASCSHPFHLDLSFIPPDFKISKQNFNFTGINNYHVTYKVIFPKNIDIEITDPSNKAKKGVKSDGRNYIEIEFNASEANLSSTVECKLRPSSLFIFGLFMPCTLSFVVVIIFIIVIIMLRRKRKRGGGFTKKKIKEEDDTGYEGKDYYMPPPPGSK